MIVNIANIKQEQINQRAIGVVEVVEVSVEAMLIPSRDCFAASERTSICTEFVVCREDAAAEAASRIFVCSILIHSFYLFQQFLPALPLHQTALS